MYMIWTCFCYDSESAIDKAELGEDIVTQFESLPGFGGYRLTNRIRTNSELSAFTQCLMQGSRYNHRKDYPSVAVVYASDSDEARRLLEFYMDDGYQYIFDRRLTAVGCEAEDAVDVDMLGRREYNRVVMLMDKHMYYEPEGGLRSIQARDFVDDAFADDNSTCDNVQCISPVRNLFHGLNRAKNGLAIVVLDNPEVFDTLLTILQGQPKEHYHDN